MFVFVPGLAFLFRNVIRPFIRLKHLSIFESMQRRLFRFWSGPKPPESSSRKMRDAQIKKKRSFQIHFGVHVGFENCRKIIPECFQADIKQNIWPNSLQEMTGIKLCDDSMALCGCWRWSFEPAFHHHQDILWEPLAPQTARAPPERVPWTLESNFTKNMFVDFPSPFKCELGVLWDQMGN